MKAEMIPVTKIDEIFDYRINPVHFQCDGRPLRTVEIQERVFEALEEHCVSKKLEYKHWENVCDTIYEVPVIGHIFNENYQRSQIKKEWLYYAGKLWDPSVLYLYRDGGDNLKSYLRPLCPVANSEAYVERLRIGHVDSGDGNTRNRIGAWSYAEKTNPVYFSKRQQKKFNKAHNHHPSRDYLEIDLGQLYEITHIGTLGGYPRWKDVHSFPPHGSDHGNGIIAYPIGCRRRCDPYVFVTREESLGWITDYSIQYRHPMTRKWCDYPQRFTGNVNIRDEVVHAVSLQARYLRITPLAHHQRKDFTALIYGQMIDLDGRRNSSKKSKIKRLQMAMNSDEGGSSEEKRINQRRDRTEVQKTETVAFVMKASQFSPFRTDGTGERRWCSIQPETQWRKREILRRTMAEDRENQLISPA